MCLPLARPTLLRGGTSTVELLVSMAVLTTAVLGVGRFASTTRQGLHDRELNSRIGWELANAREQIGAWQPTDVSVKEIESLPFSDYLKQELSDVRWQASVESISEPAQVLQVTLALHCTINEQAARPASLVFWIDSKELTSVDGGGVKP